MKNKLVSLLFVCITALSTHALGASFDCGKASTPTEKAVCGNPTLSKLDDELGSAYVSARATSANPDQIKTEQIAWIRSVQKCNANEPCMIDLYKQRIAELSNTKVPAPTTTANAQQASTVTSNSESQPTPTATSGSPIQESPIKPAEPDQTQQAAPTSTQSQNTESAGDIGLLGYMIVAALISIVLSLIALVISCSIVRKSVPKGNGNRFVRNLSSASTFGTLFTFWLSALAILMSLPDEKSPASVGGIVIGLALFGLGLMIARAFAVEEAGLAYDAEKNILEITASGSEADSLLDYFKPSYWFRGMRRVQLPVTSIRSLGGGSYTQTTTTYDPKTNKVNSHSTTTHSLNITTIEGQWTVSFSSQQKRDAAHTLICEIAGLE